MSVTRVRFTIGGLMVAVAVVGAALALSNALAERSAGKILTLLAAFCAVAIWDTLRSRGGSAEALDPDAYLFDWCRTMITESRSACAERDKTWGALIAARTRLIPYCFSFLREATARLAIQEPVRPARADRPIEDAS
jgi:hypothetical protein